MAKPVPSNIRKPRFSLLYIQYPFGEGSSIFRERKCKPDHSDSLKVADPSTIEGQKVGAIPVVKRFPGRHEDSPLASDYVRILSLKPSRRFSGNDREVEVEILCSGSKKKG